MKKIIIHYEDNLDLLKVMQILTEIIELGRISKARGRNQFCFSTVSKDLSVIALEKRNDSTDTFRVKVRR